MTTADLSEIFHRVPPGNRESTRVRLAELIAKQSRILGTATPRPVMEVLQQRSRAVSRAR